MPLIPIIKGCARLAHFFRPRRGAGVAEQGCLLSSCTGKTGAGGSNPPLSAFVSTTFEHRCARSTETGKIGSLRFAADRLDRTFVGTVGRLLYRLKRRWRNGTGREDDLERSDFIAKLAALVPAPRAHLRTYHGILAPPPKWHPLIVPPPDVHFGACAHVPVAPESTRRTESGPDRSLRGPRIRRIASIYVMAVSVIRT